MRLSKIRPFLPSIIVLVVFMVMVWTMRHFLGAPPCQNAPLFTIKGTNLDCAMRP